MRVLVTRPEPDASLSAERLRAAGYDALVAPVLETIFLDDALDSPQLADFVVTSRNGVRALAAISSLEMRQTSTLYTVGEATAALAAEAGFKYIRTAAGTVDQLADLIGSANGVDCKNLIYVCGRDRKGKLEDKLRANGWQVDVAIRYYADPVDYFPSHVLQAIRGQNIDAILLYSNRSGEAFKALIEKYDLSQSTNSIIFFCLAKSIESVFDGHQEIQLIVVEQPNEQSMFDALALHQGDG